MPHQVEAVTEFLLPFFLANIGMQLSLDALFTRQTLLLAILVTVLAVLTKLLPCGLASAGFGLKRATQVGMGMVPRGEVGIVVAQIGIGLAAVTDAVYGVVLFMAVATTLIAPPFLVMAFKGEEREHADSIFPVTHIS